VFVRLAVACTVALASVAGGGVVPSTARAAGGAGAWVRPVAGAVVKPFAPPATRYGRGHLGVDLAAPPGTFVHAAGTGSVTFAGVVAGARHVVVAHDGGLRTSYSFLAKIDVRRGEHVAAGAVLGTTGGTGPGHDGSVLHFGLREGETYLDPMTLFRPVDLAAVVHLAPTRDGPHLGSPAQEKRGLLEGLRGFASGAVHVTMRAARAGAHVTGVAAHASLDMALPGALPTIDGIASSLTAWMQQRRHCDAHAPPADGTGGSGHEVMVVAGIDSARGAHGRSLDVPLADLGYHSAEATYFSYASTGGAYTAADTHAPLMASARRLAAQLRAMEQQEPGREVDLVAHSQGGVVVLAFLAFVYDPADASYPPLGTVVTLSSPLRGAPLATAGARIGETRSGRSVLAAADRVAAAAGAPVPPSQAPSVRDLAEGSDFMRRLDRARLPPMVDLTTVGAVTDPVVPGATATRTGADHTVVATSLLDAHGKVTTDGDALRVMRAALEHRPVPCESWGTALATALVSPGLAELERGVGALGRAAGQAADAATATPRVGP
jgi:hypothetical protein